MTHKERTLNALAGKPADELSVHDSLWDETRDKYIREGHMSAGEDFVTHFNTSFRQGGWVNKRADIYFEEQVLEEDEETVLTLDGNGARLRHWKKRSGTPEHAGFDIRDRQGWEERIRPFLEKTDMQRVDTETYTREKARAEEEDRAFCWAALAPFEQMSPLVGHETLLLNMAAEPEWIKEMSMVYAEMTVRHGRKLFEEHGTPDFVWYFEDLGFRGRPFMSPVMYRDILQESHRLLFDFAQSAGCRVMVHSCGFVEPLIPDMIDAGMDCLQSLEVKAGMDLPHLAERFGERISFCGNIDVRLLARNDPELIDKELKEKILPVLRSGTGYILHSDHSIPPQVEYDTLRYFFDQGRKTGSDL